MDGFTIKHNGRNAFMPDSLLYFQYTLYDEPSEWPGSHLDNTSRCPDQSRQMNNVYALPEMTTAKFDLITCVQDTPDGLFGEKTIVTCEQSINRCFKRKRNHS